MNINTLKTAKKQKKLTLEQISNISGIPKRTVDDIFSGRTKNPRIDTIQPIERALGIAPTFTDEERALGIQSNHAIVLSDKDRELIHLFDKAEKKLGENYVNSIKQMVQLAIELQK